MKKRWFFFLFILSILFLFQQCVSAKKRYDIPGHFTEVNKKLVVEKAEKGRILYKLHCAQCHGIFTKNKDGVPDFSQVQIDNYHTAALIGIDKQNHAIAQKMSNEQIDQVITFLTFRKKTKPLIIDTVQRTF